MVNVFAEMMGALEQKGGQKGTGVRKDANVNPTLSAAEKARYTNIFTIMKDVIAPGPEARDIGGTAAASIGGTAQAQKAVAEAKGEGDSIGGMIGKLLGAAAPLVAGLGAAVAGIWAGIQESFEDIVTDVVNFGAEVASDVGNFGALALKVAKLLPLNKLKFIPLLGPLINFGMAFKYFKEDKMFDGMYELVSGIAGLIPGGQFISMGMDAIRMIYDYNNPVNEETGERDMDFGTWLKTKSLELGAVLLEKLDAGSIPLLSGLWKFGKGIGYMITGDFAEGFKEWSEIIPALLGQGENEGFLMAFDAFTDIMATGIGEAGTIIRTKSRQAFEWMDGIFAKIGSVFMGLFDTIYNFINDSIDAGIEFITDLIPDFLKGKSDSEGFTPTSPGTSTGMGYGIGANYNQFEDSEAFNRRLQKARDAGYDSWFSYEKAGFAWRGTEEDRQKYIEDGFISKDGRVTRIDDEDSILAAKRGGPIEKMLDQNSAIQSQQLNVLVAIRNEIIAIKNAMSTDVTFGSNTLTQEFYR